MIVSDTSSRLRSEEDRKQNHTVVAVGQSQSTNRVANLIKVFPFAKNILPDFLDWKDKIVLRGVSKELTIRYKKAVEKLDFTNGIKCIPYQLVSRVIADAIQHAPHARQIIIDTDLLPKRSKVGGKMHILEAIVKHHPQLEALTFTGEYVASYHVEKICALKNLKALKTSYSRIYDRDIEKLIKQLPKLKSLDLRGYGVRGCSVANFAHQLNSYIEEGRSMEILWTKDRTPWDSSSADASDGDND